MLHELGHVVDGALATITVSLKWEARLSNSTNWEWRRMGGGGPSSLLTSRKYSSGREAQEGHIEDTRGFEHPTEWSLGIPRPS